MIIQTRFIWHCTVVRGPVRKEFRFYCFFFGLGHSFVCIKKTLGRYITGVSEWLNMPKTVLLLSKLNWCSKNRQILVHAKMPNLKNFKNLQNSKEQI